MGFGYLCALMLQYVKKLKTNHLQTIYTLSLANFAPRYLFHEASLDLQTRLIGVLPTKCKV